MRAARDAWFGRFAGVRLDQLVTVDEFGTPAVPARGRTHGRAPPGERVVAAVPHGHWTVVSTIAAMTADGIVAAASFDGPTDTDVFVAFIRDGLAPALRPGQIVVMDNLAPHKAPPVRQRIESRGARLLLLPPYSPDFNPIEQAISKAKSVLRKLARRTADGLYDGIGEALASVTPADAVAYIRHCGYVLQ